MITIAHAWSNPSKESDIPTFVRERIASEEQAKAEKPHMCDVCGMRFSQASDLTQHRLTHTGVAPQYGLNR